MCGGMSVGLWQCPPSCYRAGADNNSCWELHVSTLLLLVVITLLLGTSTPPNTESRSLSFIIISMKRRDSWLVWMSPSHLKNANLAILWILSTPLNITWMLPRVLLTSSTNILQDHSKYHFGSKYTVHDITYSKSGLENNQVEYIIWLWSLVITADQTASTDIKTWPVQTVQTVLLNYIIQEKYESENWICVDCEVNAVSKKSLGTLKCNKPQPTAGGREEEGRRNWGGEEQRRRGGRDHFYNFLVWSNLPFQFAVKWNSVSALEWLSNPKVFRAWFN